MNPLVRHRSPIALAACGLLFFLLLALRLDWFSRPAPSTPGGQNPSSPHESWMVIEQAGRPIGHAHRRISPSAEGYRLEEASHMRLNTMGVVQAVALATRADLADDLSLKRFTFDLRSGLFNFSAQGSIQGKRLTVTAGQRTTELVVEPPLYLAAAVLPAAGRAGFAPEKVHRIMVFDPATLGRKPLEVRVEGREDLIVAGEAVDTYRLALHFMGVTQKAWVTPEGEVVQEEGLLGIRLRKVSREEALAAAEGAASEDLTRLVALPANRPLPRAREMSRLAVRLSNLPDGLALDGGRQTFDPATQRLTIQRETVGSLAASAPPAPETLLPSPLIEADHPLIRERVLSLIDPTDAPLLRIRKIMDWIATHIEKRPVLSLPSALATLEQGMGDCNEHAALLAAMARAAGIPAQVEAGLVYNEGRFFYHAWNLLWLDGWVTADALMGQLPADVTHIRLVRGEAAEQLDLLGAIGKAALTVLEE